MPGSSPDDTVVDPQTPTTPADPVVADKTPDVSSESSTETKGGTMLDAVKAAIEPKAAAPAVSTPDDPAEVDPTKPKSEDDEELSADEKAQLSEKTQRRFKDLTSRLKAKDQEITSFKSRAYEYDKLEAYVRNAGLTNDDVAGTLLIAAQLRNDPRAALERLTPIVRQLEQIVGETLPPELQERVRQGFLTEEDARAQSRAVAGERIATRQATAVTEAQRRAEAVRAQEEATNSTLSSVETWESAKAAKDPDWHLKRGEIAEQVELAILQESTRRGQPWFPNPQEAIKLSEDALKKWNERHSRFVPTPTAITPATGTASTRSVPAPTSMLDVVRQTVGR